MLSQRNELVEVSLYSLLERNICLLLLFLLLSVQDVLLDLLHDCLAVAAGLTETLAVAAQPVGDLRIVEPFYLCLCINSLHR